MKLLYIGAFGRKLDLETQRSYDLQVAYESIREGLATALPEAAIVHLRDFGVPHVDFEPTELLERLEQYDVLLFDMTTNNPNIVYLLGRADAVSVPVVLMQEATSTTALALQHRRRLLYGEGRIEKEFLSSLAGTIRAVKADPTALSEAAAPSREPANVFISYSHKDEKYLKRLLVHLRPLERKGLVNQWSDLRLQAGDFWRSEIEGALSRSGIAILLVSADFLASDFIIDNELAPLLASAEVRGTRIMPVIIKPCRFMREKSISQFQAINPPDRPLSALTEDESEVLLDTVASTIEKHLGL